MFGTGAHIDQEGLKLTYVSKNKEDTTPADQALLMLLEGAIRFTKEAIETF